MSSDFLKFLSGFILIAFFAIVLSDSVFGQDFRIVSQTSEFTDYEFRNDSLFVQAPLLLSVPVRDGSPRYTILEQEFATVSNPALRSFGNTEDYLELIQNTDTPFTVVGATVEIRKQWKSTVAFHVARKSINSEDSYLINRKLRVRVYNEPTWVSSYSNNDAGLFDTQNHPLTSGTWYKIPISENGIHRIDAAYLESLGVNVSSVDPRNIQIWGTNGYELPKPNAEARPEWSELPIIVQGEGNGQFNSNDAILFYGNDANRIIFNSVTQDWDHEVHSYSNNNYVFLTVADTPGRRLNTVSLTNPTEDITTFRDFIWKEEELFKPESRLRSGTQWFGQQFTPEFASQTIFEESIPGFIQGSSIEFRARMGARARTNTGFTFTFNNENIGQISITGLSSLTGDTGQAARFGNIVRQVNNVNLNDNQLRISALLGSNSGDTRGWVDFIQLRVNRALVADNDRLHFLSPDDITGQVIARYRMSGFSSPPIVMDVTNPVEPVQIAVQENGNNWDVVYHANNGRQFIAQTSFITPEAGQQVANQNLTGTNFYPDYIIVTAEPFLEAANQLADYRAQRNNLRPLVVTQNQIFNEFSGGVPDPVAIRDFMRHLYLKAGLDDDLLPKYLLLFGDTTYDYKGIESAPLTNHVFTFQHYIDSDNLIRSVTYGSDDFFTFMGEDEGSWLISDRNNRLDFGVGRLPVQTLSEANLMVDKIKTFENQDVSGDWRTLFTFTADDAINGSSNDRDLHTFNADFTAEQIDEQETGIRVRKIYQFSYPVETTPAGQRVPAATSDFISAINNGTLTIHFSGHGNEQQLTAQRLFQSSDIPRLNNSERLTILVTATCSFGRFDDNNEQSGAEKLMLHPNGGSVATFTTTRVVYTSSTPTSDNNFGLHIELTREMIRRDQNGRPQTLGDIYMNSKNNILEISTGINNRKFTLLGDPAMTIGLPEAKIEITDVNGISDLEQTPLQLRALDRVVINGHVSDGNGGVNTSFNGEASVRVFDARRFELLPQPDLYCLNMPGCGFFVRNDVLFNGRVSVVNGRFSSEFIVPKDIAYSSDLGKIHVYAKNPNTMDAVGAFNNFFLNGTNEDAENIFSGPELDVFLNDDTFMNGSLVNNSPNLIVDIFSEAGINTTGSGVGHELVATLTNEDQGGSSKDIILNSFYSSALDDFTRGRIEYPLDRLEDGTYSLTVRAWDVFNNVGEEVIFFEVSGGDNLTLRNVYNYPNPMNNFTRFAFEHNTPVGESMDIFIRIFTLSGRPVAQIRDNRIATGNLELIEWNGRDDDGNRLASGTYLYHVRVRTDGAAGRQNVEEIERLVIIR